jgi:hypothetical protein
VGRANAYGDLVLGGTPFNTANPISLKDFVGSGRLSNVSLGLGIGYGFGGIVFHGIDITYDSWWESFKRGDNVDTGGYAAGTGFDVSATIGYINLIGYRESDHDSAGGIDGNGQAVNAESEKLDQGVLEMSLPSFDGPLNYFSSAPEQGSTLPLEEDFGETEYGSGSNEPASSGEEPGFDPSSYSLDASFPEDMTSPSDHGHAQESPIDDYQSGPAEADMGGSGGD